MAKCVQPFYVNQCICKDLGDFYNVVRTFPPQAPTYTCNGNHKK